MKRREVDDNPDNPCSYGFHIGSLGYVKSFANSYGLEGGDRIVIVECDPANVVSVPTDSKCQKVRTCEYKVVAEYHGPLPKTASVGSSDPYSNLGHQDEEDGDLITVEEAEELESTAYDNGHSDGYDAGYAAAIEEIRAKLDR